MKNARTRALIGSLFAVLTEKEEENLHNLFCKEN